MSTEGRETALLGLALAGLSTGGVLHLAQVGDADRWAWGAATAIVLLPTTLSAIRRLLRRETGVDVIAVLAMAGALVLGEYLTGAIIAVMLTGGAALERFAIARARRELSALLKRAPRVAHRRAGGDIVDVEVKEVVLGDVLMIKPGEVVPADGLVSSGTALLDESALTGESKPVELETGTPVRSGGTTRAAPSSCASPLLQPRALTPASFASSKPQKNPKRHSCGSRTATRSPFSG